MSVLSALKCFGTKVTVIFLIQLGPSELILKKVLIEKGGKILYNKYSRLNNENFFLFWVVFSNEDYFLFVPNYGF